MDRTNQRKGFTLVELLVVIGIIALLISVLLPSLNKAQQAARSIACASNLRTIGQAVNIYAAENRGFLPPDYQGGQATPKVVGTTTYYIFDNVHWAGNSVWYLLEQYGISNNSLVPICPEVSLALGDGGQPIPSQYANGVTTNYPNARFTYLFNKILSGMQPPTGGYGGIQPSGNWPIYSPSTSQVWAVPYKLSNIANPNYVALFMDGNTILNRPDYNGNSNINNGFNLQYQFDLTSSGHQYLEADGGGKLAPIHSRHPGIGSMSNGIGRSEGMVNVLYADSSVQSQIIHAPPASGVPGGTAAYGNGYVDQTACDPAYNP